MTRRDICALKRLQRDAFEQMLRTSERLDDLEEELGTTGRSAFFGASSLGRRSGSGRSRSPRSGSRYDGRAQVQVSGQLVYGGELSVLQVLAAPTSDVESCTMGLY